MEPEDTTGIAESDIETMEDRQIDSSQNMDDSEDGSGPS